MMRNWVEVRNVLDEVRYKDWEFRTASPDNGSVYYLQIEFRSDGAIQKGRKWLLSLHMTRSEIVQTALMAVIACEEHEAREKFTYRGKSVFGPHIDVEAFTEVCGRLDARTDIFSAAQEQHLEVMEPDF